VDQRSGQCHLLTHALGQALATLLGIGRQAEQSQQIACPRCGNRAVDRPQPRHEVEILHRRQFLVDHRLVRDPGHNPPRPNRIGQCIDPEHSDRAAIRAEQTRDHPQGGCLAGTVRPEQRIEFAGDHTQIQAVHRRPLKNLGKAADFQGEHRSDLVHVWPPDAGRRFCVIATCWGDHAGLAIAYVV
jgi:hypothetical protein